jgi:hypothetical protein
MRSRHILYCDCTELFNTTLEMTSFAAYWNFSLWLMPNCALDLNFIRTTWLKATSQTCTEYFIFHRIIFFFAYTWNLVWNTYYWMYLAEIQLYVLCFRYKVKKGVAMWKLRASAAWMRQGRRLLLCGCVEVANALGSTSSPPPGNWGKVAAAPALTSHTTKCWAPPVESSADFLYSNWIIYEAVYTCVNI